MAISVSIPKEITEYEEKIIFGLSLRKLICSIVAVVLCVGTGLLCVWVFGMSIDMAGYIIIAEAIPIIAVGFVKKDGMTFEKYAFLIIRHKFGKNRLSYEAEVNVDSIPDFTEDTQEESKYAWIFAKETGTAGKGTRLGKRRQAGSSLREANIFKITKKDRKRKCKEARRAIKAAQQEYREAKRRAEKAVEESCST